MTDLERVLIERFGEKNVRSIDVAADEMPLLEVNFEVKNQMKILMFFYFQMSKINLQKL